MTTGNIVINGAEPYINLVGTEGSNDPCGIREKAGNFEVYDVSDDSAMLTIAVATGAVSTQGTITSGGAIVATTAKTDGQVEIPLTDYLGLSGTWTITDASQVLTLTRTAATASNTVYFPIALHNRTTSLKGFKPTSLKISYVTTGGASSDVIQTMIQKQTIPADASGATGSILAGDDDADYDSSHNTNAKRYAAASHTYTVTIPEGEQAYAADGEQYYVKVLVTDAASADLTFAITGLVLNYTVAEL